MSSGNPFADFGGVVRDDRFLGRNAEFGQLASRLLGQAAFGSVALVGMPRVGKTSLAGELIRRNRTLCAERGILAIRVEVGSYSTVEDLIRSILDAIVDEIFDAPFVDADLRQRIEQIRREEDLPFGTLRRVFRQFRRRELRILCILDEFDAGRRLLKGTPEAFHWIRELSSSPEFKGALVLIAKRNLHEVARLAGHNSDYWSNVLMTITLRGFSDEDLELWKDRLRQYRIDLPGDCMEAAIYWCGRNPFLLDVFSFKVWEGIQRGIEIDRPWIECEMKPEAITYYKQVVTVLRDGDTFGKVQQVLVGPQWNVTSEEVRTLCDYGVLSQGDQGVQGFCRGFEAYLAFVQGDVAIWPLWSETEYTLRSYLEERLIEKFGEDWVPRLKRAQRKLTSMLEKCENNAVKDQRKFGERASTSLLDYSYPMDLYQIMTSDWQFLGFPLLGRDKADWERKMALLAKVRTPIAHNRGEVVHEGEMTQAEGYCREILERIKAYRKIGDSSP